MPVEGLRANAVNVIGFKALQMLVCLFKALQPRLAFSKSVSFKFEERFVFRTSQKLLYDNPIHDSKPTKVTPSPVKIKSLQLQSPFFPCIGWPMSAEGVFKEALLFCLLIESLLESHSWISLAGQSGKAWWGVARPICSGEFCRWIGFQICQCPKQIYLCALPLCSQIIHSPKVILLYSLYGTSEISRCSKTQMVVLTTEPQCK